MRRVPITLLLLLAVRGVAAPEELDEPITSETFDAARLARAIFAETNRVRREHELFEFTASADADAAAHIQASLGHLPGLPPHTNPFWGVATLGERVQRVGLSAVRAGENAGRLPIINTEGQNDFGLRHENGLKVAVNLHTGEPLRPHTYRSCAADLVRRWMNSKGHRENILSRNFRVLGCGARLVPQDDFDQVFAVQVFVLPGPRRRR